MWQAEPPVQVIQSQPTIYLAAKSNVQQIHKKERVLGVCQPVEINMGDGHPVALFSITDAAHYMYVYEKKENFFGDGTKAKVTLVSPPKSGKIEYVDDVPVTYLPNQNFEGYDSFVLQVEQDGIKVKIKYFILVDYAANLKYITCPETPKGAAGWWKISLNPAPDYTQDIHPLLTYTGLANSPVTVETADLSGSAIGSTTAQTITLDTDAAGHSWFVDSTPQDNSEYLPTSNPNQWIAREGTEAANKMDLLSVLLHEYGHALGIAHSADSNDYMAATLAPGVRRLPSSEELSLMAQLAGQARLALDGSAPADTPNPALPLSALGFALIGRLRRTDYGAWTLDAQSAQLLPQKQIAINATLSPLPNPLPLAGEGASVAASGGMDRSAWQTSGNVTFDGQGKAILGETATAQSRLSQSFLINPGGGSTCHIDLQQAINAGDLVTDRGITRTYLSTLRDFAQWRNACLPVLPGKTGHKRG
jgi:hypothetical protein